MKRQAVISFLIFSTVILLGSLGACSYWHMTPEEKARWFTDEVSEELELDDNQKIKLEHLVNSFMKSREAFYKDRQESRAAVLEMVQDETFDQQRALSMIREKTRLIGQQAPSVIGAYAEFHNSLSNKQRSRIHERLTEMFEYYDKQRDGS